MVFTAPLFSRQKSVSDNFFFVFGSKNIGVVFYLLVFASDHLDCFIH